MIREHARPARLDGPTGRWRPRHPRRWWAVSAVVVALTAATASTAPATAAQNATVSTATATTTRAADLSMPVTSTYSVTANASAQEIRIPMAQGLTPARFQATATPDSDLTGRVEVLSGGQVVQTVAINGSRQAVHIDAPLSAGAVEDQSAVLSIRYLADNVNDPDSVCLLSNLGSIRLTDVNLTTAGTPDQPTAVGDFLDSSVTAISIRVADPTDADQRQAALTAAVGLKHKYGSSAAISVTSDEDTSRAVTTPVIGGRIIRILSGEGDTTTTVGSLDGVSALSITGTGDGLDAAASALGDGRLPLAGATQVGSLAASDDAAESKTELTLTQLGDSQPVLQGIGQSTTSISVAQADFAQAVQSATVHLTGAHTALPANISAALTVTWNDQIVDSTLLTADDVTIDRTIDIPESLMKARNTLRIELDAEVNGQTVAQTQSAGCGSASTIMPVRVTLDGNASTVTAQPGQQLDAGFERFPQVLAGVVPVAMPDTVDADTLTDAAQLLIALQGASSQRLTVQQENAETFISSGASGLLVGATSAQINELDAPLRMGQFRSIDQANGPFKAGVAQAFAALQAFHADGRDVIALAAWQPDGTGAGEPTAAALQHHLTDSLAADPSGWSALYDDLVVAQSLTDDPVLVDSNAIVPQDSRVNSYAGYIWWGVAVVGALLLLLLAGGLTRHRMLVRARRVVDAEEAEEAEGRAEESASAGMTRRLARRATPDAHTKPADATEQSGPVTPGEDDEPPSPGERPDGLA